MAKRNFLNQDRYKSGFFTFPQMENIPESEKNKPEYNLEMCKGAFSLYMNDQTAVGYSLYDYFDLFRLYDQGRQPSNIYKSYLSEQLNSEALTANDGISRVASSNHERQFKGWMNVDFDNIFTFMPKVARMFDGYMSDVDFDIKASNIDIDSGTEEEDNMLEYWAKSRFLDDINEINKNAGLPLETLDYRPESLTELEVVKEQGGFKQPYVMDLEKCLTHTANVSKWKEVLMPKIRTDLRNTGIGGAYRFFNEETCREEWGYVDPSDYIGQYSKHNDFVDSTFKGFVKRIAIHELRQKGFKEEELENLSKKLHGLYDNPTESEWNNHLQRTGSYFKNQRQDFRADVLYLWWHDVMTEKEIKYITKNNEVRLFDYDKKIQERKKYEKERYVRKYGSEKGYREQSDSKYIFRKEEVKETRVIVVRHCKWIIGTELVYDYGLMKNQIRPKYTKPELPIVMFKINGRSMTDLLTKSEDLYNLAALRFENSLSKATEAGYAVDTSVMVAGEADPIAAISLHRQTGYFLYEGMTDGINRGGSPVPITKLPGTLGDEIMVSLSIMDSCLKFVEDNTGFNPVTLGATPEPDSQVGTQKMMAQATLTSMKTYEDAIKYIKQQLATSSAEAIQLILDIDKKARKEYAKVIGKDGVERILKARKLPVQYGIKMEPKPKNADIEDIMNSIEMAYQIKLKSPDTPGLTESQRIQLKLELKHGANVYDIMYKMNDWVRRDEKEIERRKREYIELQGQQNIKLKQQEGANLQEAEKIRMRNKVIETNLEAQKSKAIENQKTRGKIIEKLIEKDADFLNKIKEYMIQSDLLPKEKPVQQPTQNM